MFSQFLGTDSQNKMSELLGSDSEMPNETVFVRIFSIPDRIVLRVQKKFTAYCQAKGYKLDFTTFKHWWERHEQQEMRWNAACPNEEQFKQMFKQDDEMAKVKAMMDRW